MKREFLAFGEIREITVKTKVNSANTYAFVEYERIEDAAKAQEE